MADVTHPPAGLEELTQRELDVLELVAKGLTLLEIAERLNRSIKTIESHRASLGKKLNASNRVELARIAIAAGLAPLEGAIAEAAVGRADWHEAGDVGEVRVDPEDEAELETWSVVKGVMGDIERLSSGPLFHELLRSLCRRLGVDAGLVSDLNGPHTMRMLFCLNRRTPRDIRDYDFRGMPCDTTMAAGFYEKHHGVLEQHPGASPFQDSTLDSYMGVRLDDPATSEPIGVLAVGHSRPIDGPSDPASVLRVLAPRVAMELVRVRLEEQVRQLGELVESLGMGEPGSTLQKPDSKSPGKGEALDAGSEGEGVGDGDSHGEGCVQCATVQAQLQRVSDMLQHQLDQHRHLQEHFREVVEAVPDAVGVLGRNRLLRHVNRHFCELLGRPPSQVLGRSPAEFMPEEDAARFKVMDPMRESGDLGPYSTKFVLPDGRCLPVRITPRIHRDRRGGFVASIAIVEQQGSATTENCP